MRILLWHGWLLEGSGSNVIAARVTETLRDLGHDVLLLCQAKPDSAPSFIDEVGSIGKAGVSEVSPNGHRAEGHPSGRAVLLRPDVGPVLPVFDMDEYEQSTVKRFVDLTGPELDGYLDRNVAALRAAVAWHGSQYVIASHVVPGGVVAARALDDVPYLVYVHGSDLEYAVRQQDRYADLAREAMERPARVAGGTRHVVDRALAFAPSASGRVAVIAPGVDVERFRPRPRRQALEELAALLANDPDAARGRQPEIARRLSAMIGADPEGPDRLAREYDQDSPDPGAASRLLGLAETEAATVAYLGKFIPQKGVELFIQAMALQPLDVQGLAIGFGRSREWLEALVSSIESGGTDLEWVRANSGLQIEISPSPEGGPRLSQRLTFTGRLGHRYAPMALAAADVLVVPSAAPEAFGMVTAEGASAGCLPVVARHSGLAEVAEALEAHVGRPGAFGFLPGPGAVRRLAQAIHALIDLPAEERDELRREVSAFARSTWTWERTASQLIEGGASQVSHTIA